MGRIRRALGIVGAAGVLAGGGAWSVGSAAPAAAYPGDPMDGCETQIFANYCDGPIRPDGSWRRCLFTRGSYSGGFDDVPPVYTPPVQNCFLVPGPDEIPPVPLGQPPHHIDQ